MARVLAAVPGLVADALERLLSARLQRESGLEGEIAAPIELRVALRPADLSFVEFAVPAHALRPGSLAGRIDAAVRAALAPHLDQLTQPRSGGSPGSDAGAKSARAIVEPSGHAGTGGDQTRSEELARTWQATVLRALLGWRGQGALASMLASMSEPVLAAWHGALLVRAAEVDVQGEAAPTIAGLGELRAEAEAVLRELPTPASASPLAVRLYLVVELAARRSVPPGSTALRRLIDELVPYRPAGTEPPGRLDADAERMSGAPAVASALTPSASASTDQPAADRSGADEAAPRPAQVQGGGVGIAPAAEAVASPVSPDAAFGTAAGASGAGVDSPAAGAAPASAPRGDARRAPGVGRGRTRAPVSDRMSGVTVGPAAGPTVRDGDYELSCVLPFLVLGQLVRIGYIETLHAAVSCAGAATDMPLVAAALAYKLLAPPDRGWKRAPSARRDAALFAGLAEAPDEAALGDLARRLEAALAPADAFLTHSLEAGHSPGVPLLLTALPQDAGGGLLLVDMEGLFPLRWLAPSATGDNRSAIDSGHGDGADVVPDALRAELILVAEDAATPARLRALDRAGLRFVTDAPPARGERWRCLRRRGIERWSNDGDSPPARLWAAGRVAARATELARGLWTELSAKRSAVPLRRFCALDRTLTLAAAVGLGGLAWQLWREREPTDPMLASERMATLDARVSVSPSHIRVRIPLGQRYQALYRARLVDDLVGVPWLGGRTVRFSGG